MSLKINEIFYSIQGESLYAGRPCIFIRLSGCNLRCTYCDTRYAWDEGVMMDLREVTKSIQRFDCRLVEITGGEPLIQEATPSLAAELIHAGYTVLMETNGSIDIRPLPADCIKIMDIKCPSSNEAEKNFLGNIPFLGINDQVKFVISDSRDYSFACTIVKNHCRNLPGGNILFSVNTAVLNPQELAAWILKDGLDVRLHMQLHKILWPEIERGV